MLDISKKPVYVSKLSRGIAERLRNTEPDTTTIIPSLSSTEISTSFVIYVTILTRIIILDPKGRARTGPQYVTDFGDVLCVTFIVRLPASQLIFFSRTSDTLFVTSVSILVIKFVSLWQEPTCLLTLARTHNLDGSTVSSISWNGDFILGSRDV